MSRLEHVFCVLIVPLLFFSACETGDPRPNSERPTEKPDSRETAWLAHDDGESVGSINYDPVAHEFYEYVRFRPDEPVRIHTVRAQVDVEDATDVTLNLWDGFGDSGAAIEDGAHLGESGPLAAATRRLTTDDSGQWVDFTFEEPVVIDPARRIFAGLVVQDEESPQLMLDKAPPELERLFPYSIVWKPSQAGHPLERLAVGAAPGDFLVRLEAERIHEPDHTPIFEARDVEEVGLGTIHRVALEDVDDDGNLDVMLDGPRLYLNDGSGQFTEVTDDWLPDDVSSNGGVFGDFDNDGDADYFATGSEDHLLEQRGDRYVDVTDQSGIDDTQTFTCDDASVTRHAPTEAAAWFDVDGDGRLDLYQANYHCSERPHSNTDDRLWHNDGDATFSRIKLPGKPHAGRGVAPADADGDGDVDLLVANYRLDPNFFFQNDAGELTPRGFETGLRGEPSDFEGKTYYGHSIGAAWGDVNQDGALDVFVANLAHPRHIEVSQTSALYINKMPQTGTLGFDNQIERAGIRYQETASNPTLWDYDNDGDLDLFLTSVYRNRFSMMYRNDGHPDWTEVSHETGIQVENGWGSAVGDLDGDGDLDLLSGDTVFLNRNPSGHNAVFVRPVGQGAIGARVTATVDGETVLRERYGGHGTGVQKSPWLHVGIGNQESVDLEVTFSGSDDVISILDVDAGRRLRVSQNGRVDSEKDH